MVRALRVHASVRTAGACAAGRGQIRALGNCALAARTPEHTWRPAARSRAAQMLVAVRTADGSEFSLLLQNAETVKLVGPAAAPDDAASGPEPRAWRTISMSALALGDEVLVHRPVVAARHMGIPIDEYIREV